MAVIKYARVTLTNGDRFFLRLTYESERFVRGLEVTKDGDPIEPPNADERLRIIERGAIKKLTPMHMNNHYATLEVTK